MERTNSPHTVALWFGLPLALFLLLSRCTGTPDLAYADDPMNKPLNSVGVSGHDANMCNDKWNTCTDYDRSQFDTKYPGTSLESISLYPLKEGVSRDRQSDYDSAGSEEEGDGETDNGEDEG